MLAPPPPGQGWRPILQGTLDPSLKVMNTFCIQTCVEKEAVLHIENHQVINLTNKYGPSGCELVPVGDENILECSGSRSFRSARERWWYIAVSHCDNAKVKGTLKVCFVFFLVCMWASLFMRIAMFRTIDKMISCCTNNNSLVEFSARNLKSKTVRKKHSH